MMASFRGIFPRYRRKRETNWIDDIYMTVERGTRKYSRPFLNEPKVGLIHCVVPMGKPGISLLNHLHDRRSSQ
jgi:hypothetical protein